MLDATRVVDEDGRVLWEGGAARRRRAPGRRRSSPPTGSSTTRPSARGCTRARPARTRPTSSAAPLARTGRLAGCLRVVSDTPERPLGGLAGAVKRDGRIDWLGLARGVRARAARLTRAPPRGSRLGRCGAGGGLA